MFNSASQQRECSDRYLKSKIDHLDFLMRSIAPKVNVMMTDASLKGHYEVDVSYGDLQEFFSKSECIEVFRYLKDELDRLGFSTIISNNTSIVSVNVKWNSYNESKS